MSESIETYACYIKSKRILESSSSGGVFFAIASTVINIYKGIVYGCVIKKGIVFHERTDNIDGLYAMLGSKYVRSELRNCFEKCKNDLLANKFVLFSGTPCQINALCFYLDRYNIDRNNLLTLDIICHGTPTKVSWQKYLDNNFLSGVPTPPF